MRDCCSSRASGDSGTRTTWWAASTRTTREPAWARELRRAIDRHLRQPLAEELLRHGDGAGTVRVRVEGGKLRLVSSQAERPFSKSEEGRKEEGKW